MTDDEFAAWPKCAVPVCQNKCCRALGSRYCWPHTPGTPLHASENLRETEPEVANARQIADDLLETLREVVRVFDSHPSSICDTVWVSDGQPETLYDRCRAAIDRATGEEKR